MLLTLSISVFNNSSEYNSYIIVNCRRRREYSDSFTNSVLKNMDYDVWMLLWQVYTTFCLYSKFHDFKCSCHCNSMIWLTNLAIISCPCIYHTVALFVPSMSIKTPYDIFIYCIRYVEQHINNDEFNCANRVIWWHYD